MKQVAFLATGEELLQADLPDSNSIFFAQQCIDHDIQPGQRLIVGDHEADIAAAIQYLLSRHTALIIIGGLGPTSDDRTRYALAQAIQHHLIFYNEAWKAIIQHLKHKGLEIPDNNRQQALFPKGSTLIHNPKGTAAGCYLPINGKDIVMLPGPPHEARPMFVSRILPLLTQQHYAQPTYRQSWLLLGASEGSMAAALENIPRPEHCHLGYRVRMPYLEIKLWSQEADTLPHISQAYRAILAPYLISEDNHTASTQLIHYLKKTHLILYLQDQATHGHLEACLYHADTARHINFHAGKPNIQHASVVYIKLLGLTDYWETPTLENQHTELTITIESLYQSKVYTKQLRIREGMTPHYAVAMICWTILQFLLHQHKPR